MEYKPFFGMNVLLSADALNTVAVIAGVLVFFHAFFAVYFVYRFIFPVIQKSTDDGVRV